MGSRLQLEMAVCAEERARGCEAKRDYTRALWWLRHAAESYVAAGKHAEAAECWVAAESCCRALREGVLRRLEG